MKPSCNTGKKRWLFLPLIAAGIFIFSWIVMLLWNFVIPDVLGFKAITLWQAMALLALCKILFGGFGSGHRKSHMTPPQFKQRWMNMSEEERERLRQEWQKRQNN